MPLSQSKVLELNALIHLELKEKVRFYPLVVSLEPFSYKTRADEKPYPLGWQIPTEREYPPTNPSRNAPENLAG